MIDSFKARVMRRPRLIWLPAILLANTVLGICFTAAWQEPQSDSMASSPHAELTRLNSIIQVEATLGPDGIRHYDRAPLDEARLHRIEQLVQREESLRQLVDAILNENSSMGAIRILNRLYPQFALQLQLCGLDSHFGGYIPCVDKHGETTSVLVPLSTYVRFAHSYWTIRLFPPKDVAEQLKQDLRLIKE